MARRRGNPELEEQVDRHHNLRLRRHHSVMASLLGLQALEFDPEMQMISASIAHQMSHASKEARRQTRKTKQLLGNYYGQESTDP